MLLMAMPLALMLPRAPFIIAAAPLAFLLFFLARHAALLYTLFRRRSFTVYLRRRAPFSRFTLRDYAAMPAIFADDELMPSDACRHYRRRHDCAAIFAYAPLRLPPPFDYFRLMSFHTPP